MCTLSQLIAALSLEPAGIVCVCVCRATAEQLPVFGHMVSERRLLLPTTELLHLSQHVNLLWKV